MRLFRIIRASIKAKCKPPEAMFPFDVMSSEEKSQALNRAIIILNNFEEHSDELRKLANWWLHYFNYPM